MTDTDIQIMLDRATRDLAPPPDLLATVRAGSRRRVRHRRATLGAGLAVLLTAIGGGLLVGPVGPVGPAVGPRPAAAPTALAIMAGPTRGDLADDRAFLRTALQLWTRSVAGDYYQFIAPAQVIWAGRTPVGKAAVVAQSERPSESPAAIARVGFVEPGADGQPLISGPTLVEATSVARRPPAMLIGAKRDTLVVLDGGGPIELSTSYRYRPDGTIHRDYRPVTFTDGAAVLRVPPQTDGFTIALAPPGHQPGSGPVEIANVGDPTAADGTDGAERQRRVLPRGEAWWEQPLPIHDRYTDPLARHSGPVNTCWDIYARTPDGRNLLVSTQQYGRDPVRIFYALGTDRRPPVGSYGGQFSPDVLDVLFRLPDRQGFVVAAADATLRYRTGAGGAWQSVHEDAALLPDATTEVEVTRPDTTPRTVRLG